MSGDCGMEGVTLSSEILDLVGIVGMDFIVLVVFLFDDRILLRGGVNEVCRFAFVVSVESAFDVTVFEGEV